MNPLRRSLRAAFALAESGFDRAFGARHNPFHHLGALGFFLYWIVAASGFHLYVGFDTSVGGAYASVERLSSSAWFLGGVVRSLHRYASDGLVAVMLLHMLREFSLDRYRGVRWFSWLVGVPILWLVYASGIGGYWLVWDRLAQFVAVATTEWLDALPLFGEPIARNFLAPGSLDSRLFTLLVFLHIAIPLILLFVLWIHLQRVSRPDFNPPRRLAVGTLLMLVALALVFPARSQGPADLGAVPAVVGLDWFYLALYPLFDLSSHEAAWVLALGATALLVALPWLPPLRRAPPAVVTLDQCNGCGRCADDCPYTAITMAPRSDGKPFEQEAVVDPTLCVACGICAGACPTSTPFRRAAPLVSGIDLPEPSLGAIRAAVLAESDRLDRSGGACVMAFACSHGADADVLRGPGVGVVGLPCAAMLPPSFIDFVLSRELADGVLLAGCGEAACYNRLGARWIEERLAGARDPRLRQRVPRERLAVVWTPAHEGGRLRAELAAFAGRLRTLPPPAAPAAPESARWRETIP